MSDWERYVDSQEEAEAGKALADAIRALWELEECFPTFKEPARRLRRACIMQWESGMSEDDLSILPWHMSNERHTVWESGRDPDDPNNYDWNPEEP